MNVKNVKYTGIFKNLEFFNFTYIFLLNVILFYINLNIQYLTKINNFNIK
jgi:hypothetical protein